MTEVLSRAARYKLKVPSNKSFNWIYSSYDLEIRIGSLRIEIGRFSFGLISRIKILTNPSDGAVIKAGAFCEAASSSIILVGGEHRNDDLFNYTFSSGRIFKSFMPPEDHDLVSVKPTEVTEIGNNVVISEGCIVISGANIGEGCVIGSLALVRGNLAPYSVYGGVPAAKLRERFSPTMVALHRSARMQDIAAHCMPALPRLLHELQLGKLNAEQFTKLVDFLPARPKVIVEALRTDDGKIVFVKPVDFLIGDKSIVNESNRATLTKYFEQASNKTEEITWSPDIFNLLDLYE